MGKRLTAAAEHPSGGIISIAAGTLWQVIEAAHNWTYVCDLAHHAGFISAARHSAEPSALAMMVCGTLWVIGARLRRKKQQVFVDLAGDLAREIEAITKSPDNLFVSLSESEQGRSMTIMKWASRK
jgi:hypothetical protein